MRRLHSLRRLSGSAVLLALAPACRPLMRRSPPARAAASPPPRKSAAPAQSEQFVDGIAAVVDKDVITLRELHEASLRIAGDLKARGIQVPDGQTLQHQVLQRLIMERVQRHEADRLGIRVDDAQVDQATQAIAARNKIGVDQLRKEIEKSGLSWESYRKSPARRDPHGPPAPARRRFHHRDFGRGSRCLPARPAPQPGVRRADAGRVPASAAGAAGTRARAGGGAKRADAVRARADPGARA